MTNYDYWAAHSFLTSPQLSERAAVDYLLNGTSNPYPHGIPDLSARVALSALALLGDKEYARTGTRREAGGLSELYKRQAFQDYLRERLQHYRNQIETAPNLSLLPAGSFSISLRFTLTSPYLSKDDTALHLLDNPVKKEWVFKLPYIASTQWKGALQATMVQQLVQWWQGLSPEDRQQRNMQKRFVAQRVQLTRLFGTEIDNVEIYLAQCGGHKTNQWYQRYVRRFLSRTGFLAGRLYFYPTFFDRLGLEVINPHDRKTGAGSQPILMECVPAGTTGQFTLLYTPVDRIGQDEAETRRQVCADLQRVAAGLEALFAVYGLGAKTSSGFGVAELAGEGQFVIHYPDTTTTQKPPPQEPAYPESVREFLASYPPEYLDMKPKRLKDAGVPNLMRQQTKEIKALYQQYQVDQARYQTQLADWEAVAATPAPPITQRAFSSFAALADILSQTGGEL